MALLAPATPIVGRPIVSSAPPSTPPTKKKLPKPHPLAITIGLPIVLLLICVAALWSNRFGPVVSILIIEAALDVALGLIGYAIVNQTFGILINENNIMSMARLQLAIWTVAIVGSYVACALSRVRAPGSGPNWQPLVVNIDNSLLVLLGISAASFVAAPAISLTKTSKEPDVGVTNKTSQTSGDTATEVENNRNGIIYANTSPNDASVVDLFQGDELGNTSNVDMAKVQLFFFTAVTACAYLVCVIKQLHLGITDHLPPIPEQLNVILGISHTGYLSSKAIVHTPLSTQ